MTEITSSNPVQIPQTKGKSRAAEEDTNVGRNPISTNKVAVETNKVAVEYQLKAIEWIEPSSRELRKLKVITQNGMIFTFYKKFLLKYD
jgi:hypothetical protein